LFVELMSSAVAGATIAIAAQPATQSAISLFIEMSILQERGRRATESRNA
jgi:hypothetical protein